MRPLFAIAPLALAFSLMNPSTTEASTATAESFPAKIWHLVFDQAPDVAPAP
ncbi:MAG: hypothetical protein V4532_04465 [Pseudomonadota bacterium]